MKPVHVRAMGAGTFVYYEDRDALLRDMRRKPDTVRFRRIYGVPGEFDIWGNNIPEGVVLKVYKSERTHPDQWLADFRRLPDGGIGVD